MAWIQNLTLHITRWHLLGKVDPLQDQSYDWWNSLHFWNSSGIPTLWVQNVLWSHKHLGRSASDQQSGDPYTIIIIYYFLRGGGWKFLAWPTSPNSFLGGGGLFLIRQRTFQHFLVLYSNSYFYCMRTIKPLIMIWYCLVFKDVWFNFKAKRNLTKTSFSH